ETDNRNLYTELRSKGYYVTDYFETEFEDVRIPEGKKFAYLTSDKDPLQAMQGRDYLLPASQLAIPFLKKQSNKGFFLMIEGSQIDWGGHANNSEYIITELLDFDKTIGMVLDWAEKDKNTLVIVTADHETGGYSIVPGSTADSLVTKFTTDYHTAVMIPVFAYGPGSEAFSGIYENTAIYHKMRKALKFK
ncbi:MAG: alkaline phosphatase, partial [Bacteroidota bacterium]